MHGYHAACPYSVAARASIHLFLYGSRDLSKAGVVFITAQGPQDRQVVRRATRLRTEKSDNLVSFGYCFPPEMRSTIDRQP